MKREIYAKLLEWQSRRDHKPLVLDGALQVGKTYILKEFGSTLPLFPLFADKTEQSGCAKCYFEAIPLASSSPDDDS